MELVGRQEEQRGGGGGEGGGTSCCSSATSLILRTRSSLICAFLGDLAIGSNLCSVQVLGDCAEQPSSLEIPTCLCRRDTMPPQAGGTWAGLGEVGILGKAGRYGHSIVIDKP